MLPAAIDGLALALVTSSDTPIVLLDANLTLVAASNSFCRAFDIDCDTVCGVSLFTIGGGEWDVPQLRALLKATLSGSAQVDAYEMDLNLPGQSERRLVISTHLLAYAGSPNLRLLLTISDVTDARLAERLRDDLLREKAVLFQELQHRVANSLQIIASVLMQTARRVNSSETRGYLFDAHSRVMSVAALQRQLATSSLADVELRPYFTELCDSIAASMIHDREALILKVISDDGFAKADVSVSLGLIVTELVINALKHAFPEGHGGHITVGYTTQDAVWALKVTDDGIGMPPAGEVPAKAGLGSSIVQALARQLGAEVSITDKEPGMEIAVTGALGADGRHSMTPVLAV